MPKAMNRQSFSHSIRAITISTLICGVTLLTGCQKKAEAEAAKEVTEAKAEAALVFGIAHLTGCGKKEIRDTSSLSKSIIGLWQMEEGNDEYLHFTPTTVREVSRQETEKVKGDGFKVTSENSYVVLKSSELENCITIALREKGETKTRHTKIFKFSTIERDACEIIYDLGDLVLISGAPPIGSFSIGRHTYKGHELPINTANISD